MFQTKRSLFKKICRSNELRLDYSTNKTELSILKSIFIDREYADYFPFYQNATVVDVGAHWGYFSIFASKNLGKASRIIAVEPEELNYNNLKINIAKNNCNNVNPVNYAIGGKEGRGKLYISSAPNHSLLSNYKMLGQGGSKTDVVVKTISWLMEQYQLKHIDFLKLDCEGAEYDIMNNLDPETLGRIRVISMEFHDLHKSTKSGNHLVKLLANQAFNVVKFTYSPSWHNLNYGRIIAINQL